MFPLRDSTKSESFPYVTIALILLNVFIYCQEALLSEGAFYQCLMTWGLVPATFMQGGTFSHAFFTIYTAMFLHGSWSHVFGNMWMLWLFGDNVEDHMGKLRYLGFYLVCGTVAALAHCIMFPLSEVPVVGASGAIAGIMGAYFVLFKRATILTWIFPIFLIRVPAVFYLGLWAVIQFVSGASGSSEAGDSVAFWAHVGGFIAGMFLCRFFLKKTEASSF